MTEIAEDLFGLDVGAAAARLEGVVRRTALVPFDGGDPRVELRLKLECQQETGSFKARGAWNNVSQLSEAERAAGVVAASSGNHGRALAWAAQRAGVKATIVMPKDAYPNKIQACRDLGAEVVLGETRKQAEELCRERAEAGAVMVHPYDRAGTIQGAGTVGREALEQWPEAELLIVPVGGGGLVAGCSLAAKAHRASGGACRVIGVEPEGAATMSGALAAGKPVPFEPMTSGVQGLTPPAAGERNTRVCLELTDRVVTLPDEVILEAQGRLVRERDWVVEPAGAAAPAVVLADALPAALLEGRDAANPLRVIAVVTGGNPDPAQLKEAREAQ